MVIARTAYITLSILGGRFVPDTIPEYLSDSILHIDSREILDGAILRGK